MRLLTAKMALAIMLICSAGFAQADQIRIAVASNFYITATQIAEKFSVQTGHRVSLSSGSTGKHYAQIVNGAPFDILLAADVERPALLESSGRIQSAQRATYAYGKLVLWQPQGISTDSLEQILKSAYRKIAIANPLLAPYGRAAKEVLGALELEDVIVGKLVQGENIAQTYQFVATGNAQLGFVALSQLVISGQESYLLVPDDLYQPIEQQMVLLSNSPAAAAFFSFMQTEEILQLIEQSGYDTHDERG